MQNYAVRMEEQRMFTCLRPEPYRRSTCIEHLMHRRPETLRLAPYTWHTRPLCSRQSAIPGSRGVGSTSTQIRTSARQHREEQCKTLAAMALSIYAVYVAVEAAFESRHQSGIPTRQPWNEKNQQECLSSSSAEA